MNRRIFVSYRRDDNPIAWGLLRERLVAEFGHDNVFFDQASIGVGDDWRQVIDRELERSTLVVAVCGRHWAGADPRRSDGPRRIDDPEDMVRYELTRAHRLGKPVMPFMIDAAGLASAEPLPDALTFLAQTNWVAYNPSASPQDQIDRWLAQVRRAVHGRQRMRSYLTHAAWMAWSAVSMVWLLSQVSVLDGLRDVHDRFVQTLMATQASARVGAEGSATEVVVIDRHEHRELFAERTPLDAEVVTILIDTLRRAAQAEGGCDQKRPVGIALELAPGTAQAGSAHHRDLATALRRLSRCRPVVLSCPQSIGTADPPEADLRWLAALSAPASADGGAPVRLAAAALDSALLRPGRSRSELGSVLGALRHGAVDGARGCACAWKPDDRGRCEESMNTAWQPDAQALLQPRMYVRRTLTHALARADELMRADIVVVGGDFARHDRLAMPIPLPSFRQALVPAQVHAIAADSVAHRPLALPAGMHYLLDLALGIVVAALTMLLWRDIALHPHLYTRRAAAYGTAMLLIFGLPLGLAQVAAEWPELVPQASLASFCVIAVGLRCGIAGYEVLLRRNEDWQPFDMTRLWSAAARGDSVGWSARLRLTLLLCEGSIGAWALARVF